MALKLYTQKKTRASTKNTYGKVTNSNIR